MRSPDQVTPSPELESIRRAAEQLVQSDTSARTAAPGGGLGAVARMRIKEGSEPKLLELGRRADMRTIPGLVAEAVYRLDGRADEYMLVVAFESREAYLANANSPEQHRRYLEYRELLADDPEWNDGEIIDTYRRGS